MKDYRFKLALGPHGNRRPGAFFAPTAIVFLIAILALSGMWSDHRRGSGDAGRHSRHNVGRRKRLHQPDCRSYVCRHRDSSRDEHGHEH